MKDRKDNLLNCGYMGQEWAIHTAPMDDTELGT